MRSISADFQQPCSPAEDSYAGFAHWFTNLQVGASNSGGNLQNAKLHRVTYKRCTHRSASEIHWFAMSEQCISLPNYASLHQILSYCYDRFSRVTSAFSHFALYQLYRGIVGDTDPVRNSSRRCHFVDSAGLASELKLKASIN